MAAGDNQQNTSPVLMDADAGLNEDQVKQMQGLLHAMDYEITSIDGIAGPETEAALTRFLTDNDLHTDGGMDQEALMLVRAEAGQSAAAEEKLLQTRQQMQDGEEVGALDLWAMQYALQAKGFTHEIDGQNDNDFRATLDHFADYLKLASGDQISRTENPGQRIAELNNSIRDIETSQSEIITENDLPLTLTGINNQAQIDELFEQTEARLRRTMEPGFNETDANGNPVDRLDARAEANETLTALFQLKALEGDRHTLVSERHNILYEENRNVQLSVSETDWRRMSGRQLVDATIIDEGIQLNNAEYQEVLRSSLQYAVEGENVPTASEIADFYIDKFAGHLDEGDQQRLHDSIERYESIEVTREEIDAMQNRQVDDVIAQNRGFMVEKGVIDAEGNILDENRYNQLVRPRISDPQSLEETIREQKFADAYPDEQTPGELSRELGAPSYSMYSGNAEIGAAARKSLQMIVAGQEAEAAAEATTDAEREQEQTQEQEQSQTAGAAAGTISVEVTSDADGQSEPPYHEQLRNAGQAIHDAGTADGGHISLADSIMASELAMNPDDVPEDLDIEKIRSLSEESGRDINHKYDVTDPVEFSDLQRANFAYSAEIGLDDIPEEIGGSIETLSYEINGQEAPAQAGTADPSQDATLSEEELRAEEARRVADEINQKLPGLRAL